jgi:hypothetical protein
MSSSPNGYLWLVDAVLAILIAYEILSPRERRRRHTRRAKKAWAQAIEHPWPLRVVQDVVYVARTVDPERPPSYVTHVQAPGDPVTRCSCHHKPLADGDRMLMWPGVELLCEDTYGPMDKGREA